VHLLAHRQRNALAGSVYLQDGHLYVLLDLHDVVGVFDKAIGELTNVDQARARCARRSRIAAMATSSSEPVASLRYRATNGTVAPSASSAVEARTCPGPIDSSRAILVMCRSFKAYLRVNA
jgi:hypothetical protein